MMRYLYFLEGSINHQAVSQYIGKSRFNKHFILTNFYYTIMIIHSKNVYYDPNDILLRLSQIL